MTEFTPTEARIARTHLNEMFYLYLLHPDRDRGGHHRKVLQSYRKIIRHLEMYIPEKRPLP